MLGTWRSWSAIHLPHCRTLPSEGDSAGMASAFCWGTVDHGEPAAAGFWTTVAAGACPAPGEGGFEGTGGGLRSRPTAALSAAPAAFFPAFFGLGPPPLALASASALAAFSVLSPSPAIWLIRSAALPTSLPPSPSPVRKRSPKPLPIAPPRRLGTSRPVRPLIAVVDSIIARVAFFTMSEAPSALITVRELM